MERHLDNCNQLPRSVSNTHSGKKTEKLCDNFSIDGKVPKQVECEEETPRSDISRTAINSLALSRIHILVMKIEKLCDYFLIDGKIPKQVECEEETSRSDILTTSINSLARSQIHILVKKIEKLRDNFSIDGKVP